MARCFVAYRYNPVTNKVEKGKCKLPPKHKGKCDYEVMKKKEYNEKNRGG